MGCEGGSGVGSGAWGGAGRWRLRWCGLGAVAPGGLGRCPRWYASRLQRFSLWGDGERPRSGERAFSVINREVVRDTESSRFLEGS